METLLNYLDSLHPLSVELKNHLRSVIEKKKFNKKSYLLKSGRISQNIYFIEKGIVRCYYVRNNKDISSWFMKEGDVLISVESFIKQIPSAEYIQALEECSVSCISYGELMFIYQTFKEFNWIGRLLFEKYYMQSEQRLFSLRLQKAKERYAYLEAQYPELLQRVPAQFIASYLGITLETLSRVRKMNSTMLY